MTDRRRWDGPAVFASVALGLAAVALVVTVVSAFVAFDRSDGEAAQGSDRAAAPDAGPEQRDDAVADPTADPAVLAVDAAEAMADVTSVEFRLERDGAAIYIDQFESIELDRLHGQFTVPTMAQAELTVTVNDNLATKIGAVAIEEEVWISNPVTGDFETLPTGYDIDPSKFFDPEGGWKPLLMNLQDVELIGIDDRGGERYHVRGVAPAAEVRNITVGLVRDQDVPVELWIHPGTDLVTAAEFATEIDGEQADWTLELDNYGERFTITPPENITT